MYDPILGGLRLAEGTWNLPVEDATLAEMVAVGVLTEGVSEFGEREFSVVHHKASWSPTFHISQGGRDALAHLGDKPKRDWCKLDMILMLARQGWVPAALTSADYYGVESPKVFAADERRPKVYFAALLEADSILGRLPVTEE